MPSIAGKRTRRGKIDKSSKLDTGKKYEGDKRVEEKTKTYLERDVHIVLKSMEFWGGE